MRFGMAAPLVLALGTAAAALVSPSCSNATPVPSHARAPAALSARALAAPASLALALSAETGDYFPPWIIDFSFWLCSRLIAAYDLLSEVVTEGLKIAQHQGNGRRQQPPPATVVAVEPPVASPGPPSPRLEP